MVRKINKICPLLFLASLTNPSFGEELGCGVSSIPAEQLEYGCGCGYYKSTASGLVTIFQAERGYGSPRMLIDGELVELMPRQLEDIPANPRIGDTFSQAYEYEGLELIFDNTVSFVCTGDAEESCEVTRFDSELSINKDQCVAVPGELFGDCGC